MDCVAAGARVALVGWAFAVAGCGEACATGEEAAGGGDVDFSARTIGEGETEAFGVGFPFASFPFGVGVAFADLFLARTIGGGVTAFAASTRMS